MIIRIYICFISTYITNALRPPVGPNLIWDSEYDFLAPRPKLNEFNYDTDIDVIIPNAKIKKNLSDRDIQRNSDVLPIDKLPWVVENHTPDYGPLWEPKSKKSGELPSNWNERPLGPIQSFTKDEQISNLTDYKPNSQDDIVKSKLFSLIKETKSSADRHVSGIENVHETYKSYKLYKIGYIVSFINKTHDSMTELFNYVQKNISNWGILKILNYYEQIKKANEFLSETLKLLSMVTSSKDKPIPLNKLSQSSTVERRINTNAPNISWPYYDEDFTK